MPTKAEIKNIASLRLKKSRDEQSLFVVEGEKMVREAVQEKWEVVTLCATKEWQLGDKHAEMVTMADMERMSSLNSPSPCLAVLKQRKNLLPDQLHGNWIVLDNLADPGNLGTIIRTAEWFGVEGVFCVGDCVELYNPKVVQSTMGSIFRQKIVYGTKENILSVAASNGARILGASMNGVNANDFVFRKTDLIVIGNESRGISEDFLSEIEEIISIQGKGRAESLNASVAAGIIMSLL